jgi:alkylated DNA repair dioxygenase AlkB
MSFLFPIDDEPPVIPGLTYVPEYLSAAEEESLCRAIDASIWDTSWDRRRQPYGAAYGTGREPAPPIPKWGLRLAERLFAERFSDRVFDQMLVNEYLPGQGISLHRDYEPYDRTVVSLSLLSACRMDFRRTADGRRESMVLAPRSLLVLSDEARYEWEHGIARRKSDIVNGRRMPRSRRLSVTFRSLKRNPPAGD